LYIDFYSIVLRASAVYSNHHQVGILVHKNSKRGEASLKKQWVKVIAKFIIIIAKMEK